MNLGFMTARRSAGLRSFQRRSGGHEAGMRRRSRSNFLKMGEKLLSVDLEKPRWIELLH